MCRHCTQHSDRPTYHDGPYGGGKNCRYNKNGKLRQSRRVNAVDDAAPAEGGDSPAAGAGENDSTTSEDDAGGSDSDIGALDEDYFPSFGGGLGSTI